MTNIPIPFLAVYRRHCALFRPTETAEQKVQLFYASYEDTSSLATIQSQLRNAHHIGIILSNGVPFLIHRNLNTPSHILNEDWQQLYPQSGLQKLQHQKLLSWDTILSYHVELPPSAGALIPSQAQLQYYHHWVGILKDLAYRSASDGIYIGLFSNIAFILILQHHTLSYANQFDLSNEHLTDALIYYLKACQQTLDIPTNTLAIRLYGEIDDASNIHNALQRYLPEVQLLKHPDTYYPQYHRFYDLFAAHYTVGLSHANH